ncbi:hypothetical protein TSOC_012513 [Tetrabaena socialis]|uniref:HNH endonuclease 5 domain-containing protein n=1 Tax=Tetrabaena socialis TaxID=47790 RepID=A0A2J7ZMU6_9CHLO|nr:hypothetical protein TSOC_012513 [Tetrabaena socialis]|eukprot:PNH01591.1 hypothetical protein TSOC_012513 [Tetrabaena socialis]
MKVTRVDDVQERWYCTLQELVVLPVQVPALQRPLDDERVDQIVAFQEEHRERHGTFRFLGDVAVMGRDEQGRLYVVDGQHRLAAARSLRAKLETQVTVLVVSLSEALMTMRSLFVLVNKSVPVPDWIVQGTISAAHVYAITDVTKTWKRRFKLFWSGATHPRRPNVSLVALGAALASCARRHPDAFPTTPDGIASFLDYANERLHAEHPASPATLAALAKVTKVQAQHQEPLFLSNDPAFEFVFEWLPQFKRIATSPTMPRSSTTILHDVQNADVLQNPIDVKRKLNKATRCAVWNRHFGERAGTGSCYCCRHEITQQTYECGHILAACNGGSDELSNLRPICAPCNRSMGKAHMDEFCKTMGLQGALLSFCVPIEEPDF